MCILSQKPLTRASLSTRVHTTMRVATLLVQLFFGGIRTCTWDYKRQWHNQHNCTEQWQGCNKPYVEHGRCARCIECNRSQSGCRKEVVDICHRSQYCQHRLEWGSAASLTKPTSVTVTGETWRYSVWPLPGLSCLQLRDGNVLRFTTAQANTLSGGSGNSIYDTIWMWWIYLGWLCILTRLINVHEQDVVMKMLRFSGNHNLRPSCKILKEQIQTQHEGEEGFW